MTQQCSTTGYLIPRRDDHVSIHLDAVPGMRRASAHRWRWTVGSFEADVTIEPGDSINVSVDRTTSLDNLAALQANRNLPGNLRHARVERRSFLCADTQLNGAGHLLETFEGLRTGLHSATKCQPFHDVRERLSAIAVQTAIESCRWPEGDIVALDDAWEFRARLRGEAASVRASIDGADLRVHRHLMGGLNDGPNLDAVCAQALGINARLRHARLAWDGGAVVAESRLHAGQLTPAWLETAVWAVAVACRHSEFILNVLAEDNDVAADFVATFLLEKA
jgi:hypothetical protein